MATLVITPEIEAAAQKLAEATGTTPTEALAAALREQLLDLSTKPGGFHRKSIEEIKAILNEHKLVPINDLTEADILGLDVRGIPLQSGIGS